MDKYIELKAVGQQEHLKMWTNAQRLISLKQFISGSWTGSQDLPLGNQLQLPAGGH